MSCNLRGSYYQQYQYQWETDYVSGGQSKNEVEVYIVGFNTHGMYGIIFASLYQFKVFICVKNI